MGYSDNLDIVDETPLMVRAMITLLPTSEGGRHTPITEGIGFRPNHNFGDPDNFNFHIGQVNVPKGEAIYPGQSRELTVVFLNVRFLRNMLIPGRRWRIQEGDRLVGMGEVIRIEI